MKNILLLFSLLTLALCSCASVQTSVKLRPDLTNDDTEIWEISAEGNGASSHKDVDKAMLKAAAEKSNSEGYDCFSVLHSEAETHRYSTDITLIQTMKGKSNSSTDYSTDYYSNTGYKYGSTKGTATSEDKYSYQVPVTYNINTAIPTAKWFVIFYEEDECDELKETKWRESVYYNKDYLKDNSDEDDRCFPFPKCD